MTCDDYFKMAENYRQQTDILNEKIKEKEKLLHSKRPTIKERYYNEYALRILYAMRNDVLYGMNCLLKQAKSMEDNDE